MRILFVTWDGPQVNYLESLFLPIFAGLKPHGYHFDVLQFRWGTRAQANAIAALCAASGIGYRAANIGRWGGNVGPLVTAVLGGRQVRGAIRDFGSDVVMPRSVLPSLTMLAGRADRLRPVLLDADGLELDERVEFGGMASTGLAYRLLRDVEAQMVRRARGVITRTQPTVDVLVARAGPPVTSAMFTTVANGRDGRLFHPLDPRGRAAARAEIGIADDVPLIVYAGSVGARYRTKAIGEFALALRRLRPDTQLLVLTGSHEIATRELIEPLPELASFTTLRRVPPDVVPRFLAAADVGTALIRPSFSTRGILPVKTGEYLLCGVPVFGTAAVGDNAAAIQAGVFLDEEHGPDGAAAWVVRDVLPQREEMRQRARAVGALHFSLERSIEDYRRALERLAGLLSGPDSPGNIPSHTPPGTPASRA